MPTHPSSLVVIGYYDLVMNYDHCSDANQMRNGAPAQLGVSLPKAELYLISKLPNTNVNSNSHRPDIHISIHWGQTANIMKRVFTK